MDIPEDLESRVLRWLFLATVIDLFNREVVGWSMADHMRTELISDALKMAHSHGRIEPGAMFHSDSETVRAGVLRGPDPHSDGRARMLVPGVLRGS
jgi:transposase InsO family protein